MLKIRKADPTFVNWTPVDAADAVDKFKRLQRNGLPASQIPEALIDCAKGKTHPVSNIMKERHTLCGLSPCILLNDQAPGDFAPTISLSCGAGGVKGVPKRFPSHSVDSGKRLDRELYGTTTF